jgi:hypothetical protein
MLTGLVGVLCTPGNAWTTIQYKLFYSKNLDPSRVTFTAILDLAHSKGMYELTIAQA